MFTSLENKAFFKMEMMKSGFLFFSKNNSSFMIPSLTGFTFYIPSKIIFGIGSRNLIIEEVKKYGKKVLLVIGQKSFTQSNMFEIILSELKTANIEVVIYKDVHPNPTTKLVDEGIFLAKQNNCDVVVSIGGGSVIDTGKAIAALYNEPNFSSCRDYQEGVDIRKITTTGIPFIAVPTIAGTGAEITMNSVITDLETNTKKSIRDVNLFAKSVIIDPELTITSPPNVTAYAGMDAMAHLIECYISTKSNPISDVLAIPGIKLIKECLEKAFKNPFDIQARTGVSLAALYGGIMIANSGPALAHGIIASLPDIPHGLGAAIFLPYSLEYNAEIVSDKFNNIKNVLQQDPVEFIKELNKRLDIPEKLPLKIDNYEQLADKILQATSTKRNPRPMKKEEIIAILRHVSADFSL